MFFLESARLCCGICRYASRRITEGTLWACADECTSALCNSSAWATPFSISTMARRTAVTLIGSYVALSTNTGSCISDARRSESELWILLPAGPSEPGTAAPEAWGVWCPRDSTGSSRRALIALPQGYYNFLEIVGGTFRRVLDSAGDRQPDDRLSPGSPHRLGTGIQRSSCRHYIIYQ